MPVMKNNEPHIHQHNDLHCCHFQLYNLHHLIILYHTNTLLYMVGTEANRKPMQIRKNGREAAKQDFSVTRPELVYFEHVVGEPCLKKRRQQEESYSSPVTILLLLQLYNCLASLNCEGKSNVTQPLFDCCLRNAGFCYFWSDLMPM